MDNAPPAQQFPGLEHVQHILAVSSCKGGVGKSTTAVNVAYALQRYGLRVGLLDADVYGPSLPTMVQREDTGLMQDSRTGLIVPLEANGVKLMSFGYVDPGETSGAAILRGPMVSQVITQLATRVDWGELDMLVIDFPPGTGDIQLTLTQQLNISGALIVTTPQELSFVDVVKGIAMFDKLEVPCLGVVENMSYYQCPDCPSKQRIFGEGAARKLREQYGFQNVYEMPLLPELSAAGDAGTPIVQAQPDHAVSQLYFDIAERSLGEMRRLQEEGTGLPTLSYNVGQNCELTFPDGSIVEIEPLALRAACRCALCVSETTGERIVHREDLDPDVYPTSIEPVGNYAAGVEWSDGFCSSIYPFAQLVTEFAPERA